MSSAVSIATSTAHSLARVFSWQRVLVTVAAAVPLGLVLSLPSQSPTIVVVGRSVLVGLIVLLAFGSLERWPTKLPGWLARWVLQLMGVVVAVPIGALIAYWATTGGDPQLGQNQLRLNGYLMLTFLGTLVAPWMAVSAVVRQREALARSQALAFELERSELARQALDARMRLLQAQIQPHFLFNTLANVQALVDAGSPQASKVLASLTAYLRAAVPRMDDASTTMGQELQLVRAYLELMQMRMPDRLQYSVQADPSVLDVRCPPMTLLTLVENAVRHGIDPSEAGGRIDVGVEIRGGRCHVQVSDTGVGLIRPGDGLGTGLKTLLERLQLAFSGDARLQLSARESGGARAELEFPSQASKS